MLTDDDYRALAEFRFQIRRFLAFAEGNAQAKAISAQQHQALLAIRGNPGAKMGVRELGERLLIKKHSASELATRLETRRLIRRAPDPTDGRRVVLELMPDAEALLADLTEIHRREIQRLRPELSRLLAALAHEFGPSPL